jgi:hypothetical protein
LCHHRVLAAFGMIGSSWYSIMMFDSFQDIGKNHRYLLIIGRELCKETEKSDGTRVAYIESLRKKITNTLQLNRKAERRNAGSLAKRRTCRTDSGSRRTGL